MNILFISSLYPSQPKGSGEEITTALHHMTRYWNKTENILVIRPVYVYLRELFRKTTNHKRELFRQRLLELDGVKIIVFPILKIPKIAYFYYPLYRFLDSYSKTHSFSPDIIVAHYNKSLEIGYQYSQRHQLPLVVGIHAAPDVSDTNPTPFTKRCGKILDAATRIACRSDYIYKKIGAWFPDCLSKRFVAFSGIDEHIIAEKNLALTKLNRWKTAKPQGKISIITVCGLIAVKNVDTNLIALSQLPRALDWHYTIIGDGPERTRLETLALSLGINQHVSFIGNVHHQQVLDSLLQSDIFMMVSRLESFGLVYLEAMACGNIVIGSYGEGIDGIIQHGQNGFLSPAGEAEPLALLLHEIMERMDPQTLAALLQHSYLTIQSYTHQHAAQNYLQHLKEIVPS